MCQTNENFLLFAVHGNGMLPRTPRTILETTFNATKSIIQSAVWSMPFEIPNFWGDDNAKCADYGSFIKCSIFYCNPAFDGKICQRKSGRRSSSNHWGKIF